MEQYKDSEDSLWERQITCVTEVWAYAVEAWSLQLVGYVSQSAVVESLECWGVRHLDLIY